jgi:multidrug efflux pump subunit AcrB
VVRGPEDGDRSGEALLNTPLRAGGKEVLLRAVATLRTVSAPVEIHHANGVPVLDVLIDGGGMGADPLTDEVAKLAREEKLPAGVSLELRRPVPAAGRGVEGRNLH